MFYCKQYSVSLLFVVYRLMLPSNLFRCNRAFVVIFSWKSCPTPVPFFFPGHSHSEDEEENEFEDAVEELAENFIVHVNTSQAHKRSNSNVSQVCNVQLRLL